MTFVWKPSVLLPVIGIFLLTQDVRWKLLASINKQNVISYLKRHIFEKLFFLIKLPVSLSVNSSAEIKGSDFVSS